ncbi:MAG: hypothetical protein AAFN13_11480, partial [Bacteroidota bacterium]
DFAHQVFIIPEGSNSGAITISDRNLDRFNQPLGTEFLLTVAANATGSGNIRLVLRHYEAPEMNEARDQKSEDLTPSTQEIPDVVENDLNFVYPVTIQ